MLIKSVCVFCGSSMGSKACYQTAAIELADAMSDHSMDLVYGGGNIGLMGALANRMLERKGTVTGVLPRFLNKKEIGHVTLSRLILVNSMHERKQKMSDLADAFIALPGGFGTLEELAEMLTWTQLGLSSKPLGLMNVEGFFDHLLHQFDVMKNCGFVGPAQREMLQSDVHASSLIKKLLMAQPLKVPTWITDKQT